MAASSSSTCATAKGLLQVVFDPDAAEVFKEAERLRNEFVVRVRGQRAGAARRHGQRQSRLRQGRAAWRRRWSCSIAPSRCRSSSMTIGRRGDPAALPLSRSASRGDERPAAPAPPDHARHAPLHGRQRLHRSRDADAHQGDAGGRARLSRAEPHASGQVLRAAAVAADLQAAADDVGLRPLLPDRALLPRRGPARRPAARVHAARRRDVIPDAGGHPADDGRADASDCSRKCWASRCRSRSRA